MFGNSNERQRRRSAKLTPLQIVQIVILILGVLAPSATLASVLMTWWLNRPAITAPGDLPIMNQIERLDTGARDELSRARLGLARRP